MQTLKQRYRAWLAEAIQLAEEDGLFIGAAFAQVAFEHRMAETEHELDAKARNVHIMAAGAAETIQRNMKLDPQCTLDAAVEHARTGLLVCARIATKHGLSIAHYVGEALSEAQSMYAKRSVQNG